MESSDHIYESADCTVTVERVFDGQKPIKELLLELLKKQAESACGKA